MSNNAQATSPTPDPSRRGGSGPEGRADRTYYAYVISVGDVLTDNDSEPPAGTVVELGDGQRWKRLFNVPWTYRRWQWIATTENGVDYPLTRWQWARVTFDGPVTVVELPESPSGRCDRCGFLVAEKAGGLACKSDEWCPFHGKTIEYLAPPEL